MKTLQRDILKTSFISFVATSSVLNFIVYICLGEDTPFLTLGFIIVGMSLLTLFLSLRLSKRIQDDVDSLKEYASEMSESKNYRASVKINYYQECLETSIYLKNIAKRLSQKEKKTSKK